MEKQNKLANITDDFLKSILDFFFPIFCINCGKIGYILCDDCIKGFSEYGKQRCFVCDKFSRNGETHKKCRNKYSPDQLIVVNKYETLEKDIIHRLKYQNGKIFAPVIANCLFEKIKTLDLQNYIICTIPLHNKRLRKRGYNQVDLIAKSLSKDLELKREDLLIRIKNTRPQHELGRKEREKNLDKAFDIRNNIKVPDKILLIDDLTTSGSTFREATKALRSNGAKEIICLAFARGK